jgi:hypothetical protein
MAYENNKHLFIAMNFYENKSPIIVKREFRKRFNKKPPVIRQFTKFMPIGSISIEWMT